MAAKHLSHARWLCTAFLVFSAWVVHLSTGPALLAQDFLQVSLTHGTPQIAGQPLSVLQPVLPGSPLETGSEDAVGVLSSGIVVHVGDTSRVEFVEEQETLTVDLSRGFVVAHTAPGAARSLVVRTGLGLATARLETRKGIPGVRFSVRHEPETANTPAATVFSVLEGEVDAQGINPSTPVRAVAQGEQWTIVAGQLPQDPIQAEVVAEADVLSARLHRRTMETISSGVDDTARFESLTMIQAQALGPMSPAVAIHDQLLIDATDALFKTGRWLDGPVFVELPDVDLQDRIRTAQNIPVEGTVFASAQFVGYDGAPADPDWNTYLTSVDGQPGFSPQYIASFENGGFSYLQFVGEEWQAVTRSTGELFIVGDQDAGGGWAFFTPEVAVAGEQFSVDSALVSVVSEGFSSIARGEHLTTGGGTIGGTDPVTGDSALSDAFAIVEDGQVQLNAGNLPENMPIGYPFLSLADEPLGLDVNGVIVSDQVAALGAGLDPSQPGVSGSQLVFIADTQAEGDRNAAGELISQTTLGLPPERPAPEPVPDSEVGFPSLGTPLQPDATNTVGIQFVPTGDIVAVIHHTGLRSDDRQTVQDSAYFVIERAGNSSIVRWREEPRATNDAGEPIELVDLNGHPNIRLDLFITICREVNQLVPDNTHTLCGPAYDTPTTTPGGKTQLANASESYSLRRTRRQTASGGQGETVLNRVRRDWHSGGKTSPHFAQSSRHSRSTAVTRTARSGARTDRLQTRTTRGVPSKTWGPSPR